MVQCLPGKCGSPSSIPNTALPQKKKGKRKEGKKAGEDMAVASQSRSWLGAALDGVAWAKSGKREKTTDTAVGKGEVGDPCTSHLGPPISDVKLSPGRVICSFPSTPAFSSPVHILFIVKNLQFFPDGHPAFPLLPQLCLPRPQPHSPAHAIVARSHSLPRSQHCHI